MRKKKETQRIRRPIVINIHDEEECESHSFGMVSVHNIDVRRMEHDVTEEQAYEWAVEHLLAALNYAKSGHENVTVLIVETVENATVDLVDIDTAMDLAAAQWRIDNA